MHTMIGLRYFATLARRGEAIPAYLQEPSGRAAAPTARVNSAASLGND